MIRKDAAGPLEHRLPLDACRSLHGRQAAALWAGFDPARVSPFERMRPSEIVAAGQMLVSAIVSGAIPADSSTNALSPSLSVTSRDPSLPVATWRRSPGSGKS